MNLGLYMSLEEHEELIAAARPPGDRAGAARNAVAHANFGVTLEAAGNPQDAEAAYRQSSRSTRSQVATYMNYGDLVQQSCAPTP